MIVITISHTQSQIERGFSIIKEVTNKNLQNKLLRAQRLIYDALKCYKKDAHDIEITAKMVTTCKAACSMYVITLEDICIQSLNKDMNECLDKGDASHDMAMFVKANAFRKANL